MCLKPVRAWFIWTTIRPFILALVMTLYAETALAQTITIDGTADAGYGAPVVLQNTQTGFGNSTLGQTGPANGSELDAVFSHFEGGTLYLFIAGNLESNFNKLEIFLDSKFGGQNHLRGNNWPGDFGGLNRMGDSGCGDGLRFDTNFIADYWIGVTGGGGPYTLYANFAELRTDGGGPGWYLGSTSATSNGVLSNGDPGAPAIRCTINNSNTGGVVGGNGAAPSSGPGSGAGVTTGVELAIPLGTIGYTSGLKVCVIINGTSHNYLSNQVLGGIGGGGNLGEPRAVNFVNIAGLQYFGDELGGVGACCFANGSCEVLTPAQCTGSSYQGNGTTCDPSPCQLPCPLWTPPQSLTQRYGHAMAYDAARDRTVLFGGYDANGTRGDTWEWDGTVWVRRTTTGPSPRYRHAMTYDAARGRVVLFGGNDDSGSRGDTWEWDGTTWSLRATGGPSARYGHAMTYDSARARVVLFGGYDSTYNGQTWEWDGTAWSLRASTGPGPRRFHAMAYDAARGQVVLFGGFDGGVRNDTWEWDGTDWTLRSTAGPTARYGHAMDYDAARSRVVLFGGNDGGPVADTYEWNGSGWVLRVFSGNPRDSHAMAYDVARDRMVVFGGLGGLVTYDYLGDTWEWDGTAWSLRATIANPPDWRSRHAMTYDAARGRVVLFGGSDNSQTWEWDGTAWTLRATTGPSARSWLAMAYDTARSRVVLFGGDDGSRRNDTWEWDGTAWTLRATTGPSPRCQHAMAFDVMRNRVVLFGGNNSQGSPEGDTWEWDGSTWSLRDTGGPSARWLHAMAYDAARGRVVLFGGNFFGSNATWEWDGAAWALRASTGPSPRYGHAMAYDAARGRVVLFGGFINCLPGSNGDTWQWDGVAWALLASTGPSPRYDHAMAYDAARGRVVLFGGTSYSSDTWELQSDCNHNGNADDCDIANGISQDVDGDGIPDECSFWAAPPVAVEQVGDWNNPANWYPPFVPNNNNPPGRTFSANVLTNSADVTLDINAAINTLIVAPATAVNVTAGNLTIESTRGVLNNGDLNIGTGHSMVAGVSFPIDGFTPIRLAGATASITSASVSDVITFRGPIVGFGLLTAAFVGQSTIKADVFGQTLEIDGGFPATSMGQISAIGGGTMLITRSIGGSGSYFCEDGTIDISGATGVIVAGSTVEVLGGGVVQIGGLAQLNASSNVHVGCVGGLRGCTPPTLSVLGTSGVSVGGNLDVSDGVASFGGSSQTAVSGNVHISCGGVLRGCTPPSFNMAASPTFTVGGHIEFRANVNVAVPSSAVVRLAGNFDNQSLETSRATFDWDAGPLTMEGALPQTFEQAGEDLGPRNPNGFVNNFAMGTVRIEPGRTVDFNDAFDNIPASPCEVLYVDTLSLGAGSTIRLHTCNIYYRTLIKESGANVLLLNGALLMSTTAGDMNGDLSADMNDADLLISSLLAGDCSPSPACHAQYDLNGDGLINSQDLALLVRLIVGW